MKNPQDLPKRIITPAVSKYFDVKGVIADPDTDTLDTEDYVILDRNRIIALFSRQEAFFDAVTMFKPLRRATLQALKVLADKGMIGLNGKQVSKKLCGSCVQRTLVVVFVQLLRHVQTLILLFQQNGTLGALGDQLRAYLGDPMGRKVAMYLRDQKGVITRVEF